MKKKIVNIFIRTCSKTILAKKYLVLSFVEFLEFLVRLADFLTEEGPIAQKLATFLEKLLKAHKFNFVPCP